MIIVQEEEARRRVASLCSCGHSCGRGGGSGDICLDPVDDISVMEEERVSKRRRGVRTRGGVTSPRTLRRKRREEQERQ